MNLNTKTITILVTTILFVECKEQNYSASTLTTSEFTTQSQLLASDSVTVYDARTITFDKSDGPYSRTDYCEDFGNDYSRAGTSSINEAEESRMAMEQNSLRFKLLADQIGDNGGAYIYTTIGRSTNTKILEYDVKFGYTSAPFQWGLGGKIPGLGGGQTYTGCVDASSGHGWSVRLMWRRESDGRPYLMPYVYYRDKPSLCGDSFNVKYYGNDGTYLKNGRWYRVRIEITLNTGSSYNGKLKITVKDKIGQTWTEDSILLEKTNIRYATSSYGLEIDQLLIGVYRGGSTLDWSTSNNSFVFLDNLSWSN